MRQSEDLYHSLDRLVITFLILFALVPLALVNTDVYIPILNNQDVNSTFIVNPGNPDNDTIVFYIPSMTYINTISYESVSCQLNNVSILKPGLNIPITLDINSPYIDVLSNYYLLISPANYNCVGTPPHTIDIYLDLYNDAYLFLIIFASFITVLYLVVVHSRHILFSISAGSLILVVGYIMGVETYIFILLILFGIYRVIKGGSDTIP